MHKLSAYVIVHRTQSNQTPNAIQSDTERNPIGWRTESDWTANAKGRWCSCLSCTNKANRTIYSSCLHCTKQANWQSIAAVSTAPTKQTGNLLQLSQLGFAACQSKNCTNQAIKPTILM